ncbi:glycosyl transferase family 90-domain-containing protein [Mycena rosella]|uniref:Glycosyl transferase family 90-domain-containing protein n=1 Tax=Mycena rosella TaxID=1033263 RepID=A0AAD7CW98_MYCRO|nr:glycosyl transferase family 90-domain-containing protein [Mycena rosella]
MSAHWSGRHWEAPMVLCLNNATWYCSLEIAIKQKPHFAWPQRILTNSVPNLLPYDDRFRYLFHAQAPGYSSLPSDPHYDEEAYESTLSLLPTQDALEEKQYSLPQERLHCSFIWPRAQFTALVPVHRDRRCDFCIIGGATVILNLVIESSFEPPHRANHVDPFDAADSVTPVDPTDPSVTARLAVDALYSRQSVSLAQASARYSLRTQRSPPPNYDLWYQFAQDRKCLLDEYDQIHRDFKPFYQLAEADPRYFQKMIDRAARELKKVPSEIALVEIRNGEPFLTGDTAYGVSWPGTLGRFSPYLPDMTFLLNGRDEPRVAFNYRAPDSLLRALAPPNDSTPFQIQPRPTSEFFRSHSGCNIPRDAIGFMDIINEDSGFLIASAKPGFTTDLYPMLSMAKVSPCFSDVLFPTEFIYSTTTNAHGGRVNSHIQTYSLGRQDPQNLQVAPLVQSADLMLTRLAGMSNGGMILGDNYHHFARFKLADLAREHPDLMDVAITRFAETLCEEDCNRTAVMAEYGITGASQSREELYRFKYAIDVDGTTFSGRYLGLLRSGSLVFKSTVFEEYFNNWLRPFEHYVPVKADLSDLVQQIAWANTHPEEARLIQQRGMEVARRVLTDDQNDCYFFAVLLEWARLQDYARGSSLSFTLYLFSGWTDNSYTVVSIILLAIVHS